MRAGKDKGRFLEPEEVHDLSVEQKEYLLKSGFKPYLTAHGRLKWITPGQHGYRILSSSASGHSHRSPLGRIMSDRLVQLVVILAGLGLIALVLYLAMNVF